MSAGNRRIHVRNSKIHGRGIFAAADLPAGQRVIEYKGKVITQAQADRLYDDSLDSGHTFLFTLNDKYIIDANHDGNSARWINHSCEPNCEAVIHVNINGDERKDRVFIETIKPVKAGEELTYNYGITLEVPHTRRLKAIWACLCGAKTCTGTLLQPKRSRK